MGQRERMAALEGFKTGEVGILVATGAPPLPPTHCSTSHPLALTCPTV
jgi:hypothetical protein